MAVTIKRKSLLRKKSELKKDKRVALKKSKKNISGSYDRAKEYEGRRYTGMQIGRSHKWYYDKGE